MKKTSRFWAALAMALLLTAALGVSAMAVNKDISAVEGESVSVELELTANRDLASAAVMEGELPPGLTLGVVEGRVYLTGTPERAGDYKATVRVDPSPAREEHTLRFRIRTAAAAGTQSVATPAPLNSGVTPVPTITPVPTPTPAPAGPWISKHPGGETVSANASALFTSRAKDAAEIRWYILAPQGAESYEASRITEIFKDMQVTGWDTETLALYNIPANFSNWQVECHFRDASGNQTVSSRATVTVSSTLPAAPTIDVAPKGGFVLMGQKTTLTVSATAPAGNSIKYEWFSTETNDPATVIPIPEATTDSFTPPEKEGTVYYCVGLRSVNSEDVSTRAYTPLVAVTYGTEPPVPEHVHDFGNTWYNDEIYHWQACSCGEISGYATHSYSWTETKQPTSRKEGERVGVCTVCGYQTTQTIPAQRGENGRPKGLLVVLLLLVAVGLGFGGVWFWKNGGAALLGGRGKARGSAHRNGARRPAVPPAGRPASRGGRHTGNHSR